MPAGLIVIMQPANFTKKCWRIPLKLSAEICWLISKINCSYVKFFPSFSFPSLPTIKYKNKPVHHMINLFIISLNSKLPALSRNTIISTVVKQISTINFTRWPYLEAVPEERMRGALPHILQSHSQNDDQVYYICQGSNK